MKKLGILVVVMCIAIGGIFVTRSYADDTSEKLIEQLELAIAENNTEEKKVLWEKLESYDDSLGEALFSQPEPDGKLVEQIDNLDREIKRLRKLDKDKYDLFGE